MQHTRGFDTLVISALAFAAPCWYTDIVAVLYSCVYTLNVSRHTTDRLTVQIRRDPVISAGVFMTVTIYVLRILYKKSYIKRTWACLVGKVTLW